MLWLVDGYNVIRRDAELHAHESESLAAARAALLRLLARVASVSGERFTVVFDGVRRDGSTGGAGAVQVRFSMPPERADDVLVREALRLRDGAVVVTSDRTVGDAARRAGAVAVSAERFLDAVTNEGPREDEDEAAPHAGGNPRRPSREARDTARVLRRLRPR